MKKIFVAMLALAAATACSNDELVSVNQEAIGFDNAFINNSVRSEVDFSLDVNDLKYNAGFGVYGFVTAVAGTDTAPLFTNKKVYWSDNAWKYDATQYWIDGATYNFAAIAPYSDGSKVDGSSWTVTNATPTATTLDFTSEIGQKDLIYATATATGKASGNEAVAFNFRHVLSKVKFTFENQYNATNTTIAVTHTYVTNVPSTATVELTSDNAVWTNHANETSYENFGPATSKTGAALSQIPFEKAEESYRELFFIPVAVDVNGDAIAYDYLVTFGVNIYVNGTLIKSIKHENKKLTFAPKPGCSYDVKVVLKADNIDPEHAQEPIEFTVTSIGGWDTDHNDNNTADDDIVM